MSTDDEVMAALRYAAEVLGGRKLEQTNYFQLLERFDKSTVDGDFEKAVDAIAQILKLSKEDIQAKRQSNADVDEAFTKLEETISTWETQAID